MFEKLSSKNDLNRQFSDAVFANDLEKVKNLFDEKNESAPNIELELVSGTAILIAAMKKNWELFEVLYGLNANLDVKLISNDWHLIHECVKNAPFKIVEAISEYCELDAQTETGKTALMVAIREKNKIVAEFLIKTGKLNLSIYDNDGNNAAHYAAKSGQNDIFMLLIKEGVPLNKKNKIDKYPADLIEDEFFKSSIPKIVKQEKIIKEENVSQKLEETPENHIPPEKEKLKGLSSIKRKPD